MTHAGDDGGYAPKPPLRAADDGGYAPKPPLKAAEALLALDREALLAALTLAPATYSRNRFFELYAHDRGLYLVRRRASLLRSIVRHLTRAVPGEPGEIVGVEPAGGERVQLTYVVPALGLRRTALLDPIELSLVRFAVAQGSGGGGPPPGDPDRTRVEAVLARLAPHLPQAPCPAADALPPPV